VWLRSAAVLLCAVQALDALVDRFFDGARVW
jgi:hypothetical protein